MYSYYNVPYNKLHMYSDFCSNLFRRFLNNVMWHLKWTIRYEVYVSTYDDELKKMLKKNKNRKVLFTLTGSKSVEKKILHDTDRCGIFTGYFSAADL